jgi:enoyl-CoA hydratase/carnithine racemase
MGQHEENLVFIKKISLEVTDQYLGLITLNRPKDMNPLDWTTVKKLQAVVRDLSADKGIRVIAFTGTGKAFSAGGDLKAYMDLYQDEEGFRSFLYDIRLLFDSLAVLKQPVIALVNGYCVAGGLELMLACDFAYAAESAKIGDGHAKFGQVGGGGSNIRLPRWILPARARELLFTGKLLNAEDALAWGLVNRVVPDDELLDAGLEFANTVATKSPLGISIIKEVCNLGLNMRLEDGLHLEIQKVHHYCTSNKDSREGLLAFSEKRQPKFEGR